MGLYEVTASDTQISSVYREKQENGHTVHTPTPQASTVYEVQPPFNPGPAFMELVLGPLGRGRGEELESEFEHIATTSKATYFVFRSTYPNAEELAPMESQFHIELQNVLKALSFGSERIDNTAHLAVAAAVSGQ